MRRRPREKTALGGPKPPMLERSPISIPVEYVREARGKRHADRKEGYYEMTRDKRTLGRRVELPEWIEEQLRNDESLLDMLKQGKVRIPLKARGLQRHGHIYWEPKPELEWKVPAVGVDVSVWDTSWIKDTVERIVFVVYKFGKKELERWQISAEDFRKHCKHVRTADIFMDQYMVPVDVLTLLS